jgi:hypothetical protein
VRLTATGIFSDKSTEDLTDQVSWTSADDAIAQVGNDPGTEGWSRARASGTPQ